MNRLAGILIVAICCITVIAVVGLCLGHNTALITSTVGAIVGLATGMIAYFRGKAKGEKTNGKESKS